MRSFFLITERCAGCGGCRSVCPAGCIDAFAHPAVIDAAKCTGCGLCASACPIRAIEKASCEQETP